MTTSSAAETSVLMHGTAPLNSSPEMLPINLKINNSDSSFLLTESFQFGSHISWQKMLKFLWGWRTVFHKSFVIHCVLPRMKRHRIVRWPTRWKRRVVRRHKVKAKNSGGKSFALWISCERILLRILSNQNTSNHLIHSYIQIALLTHLSQPIDCETEFCLISN